MIGRRKVLESQAAGIRTALGALEGVVPVEGASWPPHLWPLRDMIDRLGEIERLIEAELRRRAAEADRNGM